MESVSKTGGRFFSLSTIAAPAIEAGPLTVAPVARSMTLRWGGGIVIRAWPCAVLVSEGGRTSRVRIVDLTRLAQMAILGVALCACWLLIRPSLRKERSP